MNTAYYRELQRKELRKNIIFTICILLFATLSTYYIYNKFVSKRDEILKSNSLEVIFHEQNGNHFSINKLSPISDNVGLSTKAYRFTIKNNTNKRVKYMVRLKQDKEKIKQDNCVNTQIPNSIIKFAIHAKNKENNIYNLEDLENNTVVVKELGAKEAEQYTIRFWTSINNALALEDSHSYHYHGIIEVIEQE